MSREDDGIWDLPPANRGEVARLYSLYSEELRYFLLSVLRDADLVGDALQATFTKALENVHNSEEETRKGWLFRVAYSQAMEIRRKSLRDKKLSENVSNQPPQRSLPDPGDSLLRWESVERVRSVLDTLPPDQQIIVRLRIYEEKTFAEIAELLKIPLGTALTRMRTALKSLSRSLHEPQDS